MRDQPSHTCAKVYRLRARHNRLTVVDAPAEQVVKPDGVTTESVKFPAGDYVKLRRSVVQPSPELRSVERVNRPADVNVGGPANDVMIVGIGPLLDHLALAFYRSTLFS